MEKEQLIRQKFQKDGLVDAISKYQIYYQMALGTLVRETCFDEDEMASKLEELSLDINVENVLNVMIKLITNFHDDEDFEQIYEDNLKVNAFLHALKDFVDNNKDLTNKDKVYDSYHEKIMNDGFFDVKMQLQFADELEDRKAYWKDLITNSVSKEVLASALSLA
ncbi:hypothetical protein [Arcobacter sp. CECT 8985]|uniref:hypothetical protein n=1 Tax=Arcobacter sp. CECT 8985 TaxID=1935424 RepID=UPI00100B523E|nr:hypothetical protein [Arcobacter sp. CECT 8985]RXJ86367.1 hypothetical protein CRU93_08745 [Arcobacter sp. CECT 8985]